jgi:hypothetical protein
MVEETLNASKTTQTESPEFQDFDLEKSGEVIVLDVKTAAVLLGKSIRAVNRSLSGKWGNKLPDGWHARKIVLNGQDEWQITPSPDVTKEQIKDALQRVKKAEDHAAFEEFLGNWMVEPPAPAPLAKAQPLVVAKEETELEHLLREVATAHKALAEERQKHMEDLRTLFELQNSMRLIEMNSNDTARLKEDLVEAQRDMLAIKNQYQQFLSLPWWKRLFRKSI